MILQKIWTIVLLAGLLSGCKTAPIKTCEMFTDKGCAIYAKGQNPLEISLNLQHVIQCGMYKDKAWVTYTKEDNPTEYAECLKLKFAQAPDLLGNLAIHKTALSKRQKENPKLRAKLTRGVEHIAPMAQVPYIVQTLKESNEALLAKYTNTKNIRAALEERGRNYHRAKALVGDWVTDIPEGDLTRLLFEMRGKCCADKGGIAIYNIYGGLEAVSTRVDFYYYLDEEELKNFPRGKEAYREMLSPEGEVHYSSTIPIWDGENMLGWMICYHSC